MKKSRLNQCAAAAIALLTFATTAGAAPVPIPIANAGFENPVLATEGDYTASIVGWTVFNGGDIGVWNVEAADYPAQAPEGFNVAYVDGATGVQGCSQVLSGAIGQLQADASYTLTVKVGDALTYAFPGYKVQLLADGTVLAEDDNTLAPITNGTFATATLNYTYNAGLHAALVGMPLEIRLLSKGLVDGEVEFDDVKLDATLASPVAAPGGPYSVLSIGSLALNGSASLPSDGSSLSLYEWDLDNDGIFGDVTGATPTAIDYATLTGTYGMAPGANNTIKLQVTDAATKSSTNSTTVTLTAASSDADLSNLVPTPAMTFNTPFDSANLDYTATAPYSAASMTVTPTKADAGAMIGISFDDITYIPINSGSASDSIPLDVGVPKTIYLKVTAEDPGFTKTYSLTVTRSAPSNNANLSSLETSPVMDLNPTFAPDHFTYAPSVLNPTASMTVTPTKADPGATIGISFDDITYIPIVSGNASSPIPLTVGSDNVIYLKVTAQDTTYQTYTLTVTRDPDTTPPTITTLSPADDTSAAAIANLVVTFNEAIAIGTTGDITIINTDPSPDLDVTIPITDVTQVSVSGAVLTINPTAELVPGKNYAIRIDTGAIKDLFNNPFAGILDDTTWNFIATFPSYTWTQTGGGARNWTDGVNWLGDAVPNPATGATVDFSTVNIAANTTLTLGADRTAGIWKFGDTSGTQTWSVIAGNQMILAGTTPTIQVNNATTTLNNVLAGTQGLTKTGGGTLALGGTNTYSGGLTVNAGTLVASADANLGNSAGGLTFNGTCTFGNDGSWTVGSGRTITVSAGANVTFNFGGATFAGPVVGSGNFTVGKPSQGNPGLNLTNTNNTFTGAMNLSDKGSGGNASYTFSSLGDASGAGIISLGYGGQGSLFIWGTGAAAPLVLNHRQFDFGGSPGSTIRNSNTASSHANTITIKTDMLVTGTGNRTLTLGGTNTGANTFAGIIPNGPSGTVVSLTKADAGKWILGGANTYTGGTTVSGGTLTINGSLADASMSISGASTTVNGSGALTFNINGTTTDVITMTGGTLNVSGLTVKISPTGTGLTGTEYVLVNATGGTISGTFAGLTGATGYVLDYDTPNQVKLVQSGGSSAYDTWAGGVAFDADANGDGVDNGPAFLLGAANPGANALGLLPAAGQNASGLVLTFRCLDAASRGPAVLKVQWSNDLGLADLWSAHEAAVPEPPGATVNGVVFVVTENGTDPTRNDVVATIPPTAAAAGKLFGRLSGTE